MKPGAFLFSKKWSDEIKGLKETGMGYTVVNILLNDGRQFHQVLIDSGYLARIRGLPNIPFEEKDIAKIVYTGEKWDWNEEP